jgi:hypothetical protein
VIDNPNGVPVTVVIDGQPTLGVGALDFRSYGNLGAGTHDLRVTYSMVSGEGELLTSQVSIDGITPVALTLPLNPTADSVSPDEPLRYKD